MKTIKEAFKYPVVVLFFAFLAVFSLIDALKPAKATSELENRPLTQFPKFTASSLVENKWTVAFGEFTRDQFLFRDEWVSAQSLMEVALGKVEAGGVWYARDGYQIAKNSTFDKETTLAVNTEAVAQFAARFPGQVSVMIVPSPANMMSDKLRANPPQMDENGMMDAMLADFENAGAEVIDLRGPFAAAESAGEQIYYRTDHHWTTPGGALMAYEAWCEAAGRETALPDESLLTAVPDFLGTNFAKTKRFGTKGETLHYYDLPNPMTIYKVSGETVTSRVAGIMDKEKLAQYDKYGAFLHGNNGFSLIEGNGEGSILVIKDSYANSFVPYLVESYAQVGVVDLRDWGTVDALIAEEGFEEVLVLYSFASFSEDTFVSSLDTSKQDYYTSIWPGLPE